MFCMFTIRQITRISTAALLVFCGAACSPTVPSEAGNYLVVHKAPTGPFCALAVRDSSGAIQRVDALVCRLLPDQQRVELSAPGCGYLRFSYSHTNNGTRKYKCDDCTTSRDITEACPATRDEHRTIWRRVDG